MTGFSRLEDRVEKRFNLQSANWISYVLDRRNQIPDIADPNLVRDTLIVFLGNLIDGMYFHDQIECEDHRKSGSHERHGPGKAAPPIRRYRHGSTRYLFKKGVDRGSHPIRVPGIPSRRPAADIENIPVEIVPYHQGRPASHPSPERSSPEGIRHHGRISPLPLRSVEIHPLAGNTALAQKRRTPVFPPSRGKNRGCHPTGYSPGWMTSRTTPGHHHDASLPGRFPFLQDPCGFPPDVAALERHPYRMQAIRSRGSSE